MITQTENQIPAPLYDLLKIYSPSRDEAEAVGFLVSWMSAKGMQAYIDTAGNAVGIYDGGEAVPGVPPKDLVLLGHIDTVPGYIPVSLREGRLFGRGAVDAKGPLAAFAAAAVEVGHRPGWRLVVIGAVEEEIASSKGARQVARDFHPHLAIIGEPSGWQRITLGYKGRLLVDYRYERTLSHRAGPDQGACEVAIAFWNQLIAWIEGWNQGRDKLFAQLMPSLRSFQSGDDGFREWADMTLGFRLPPDLTPSDLCSDVQALAQGASLQFYGGEPAYQAQRDTILVRHFLQAIRQSGARPGFVLKTGTSDMNVVAPLWNCPIVAYGPGDSQFDHTPDEHVSVQEWWRGVEVLRRVLHLCTA